ncbi:hypothetical protein G7Y89_g5619 [Cudoniella acicularis]|uniref:Molybdopterin synthase catalytic subunit n=1 Tax=Cudoniella acicularis TaxID=354080 RepID=A0A8H4RNQ6_9HELO|nr:hypothetical protein G7Y89_g5619 [Cudoniella acicularis]
MAREVTEDSCYVALTHEHLDARSMMDRVRSPKAGAIVLFAGTTRDNFAGKPVKELQYTSYEPRALQTMLTICKSVKEKHSLTAIAMIHRLGVVPIAEESILIAVSSPHRQAAWKAGEEALEECKEKVEVWKKEEFGGEGGVWRANRDGAVGVRVDGDKENEPLSGPHGPYSLPPNFSPIRDTFTMATLAKSMPRLVPVSFISRPILRSQISRSHMTLPSFSLEGKTCVVTGGARGLGKEFLSAFALSGAKGACIDLSLQAGENSIGHIKKHIASQSSVPTSYKPELRAYACDVTSESQVQDTWGLIVKDFRKVDVVVTAAGIVDNFEGENYPFDRWKKMMDINLNGSFLFAREAGNYWIDQKMKGNLILVSSMSSQICVRPQKQAAYNAWGLKGIRVNSLCPGYMKTDLIIDLLEREGKHIEENWVKDIPMGRLGHPSDLQGTIVWMASDASNYLHGSDIVVDGGYCCW